MKLLISHKAALKRKAVELKTNGLKRQERRETISGSKVPVIDLVKALPIEEKRVAANLFSQDLQTRLIAMDKLTMTSTNPIVPKIFRQLLFDESPNVRRMAVFGLSVTGVPRDLKLIGAKLYDESPMVRVGAAHTLGGIRGREKILAHNLLSDRLMDSGADLEIRNACIQGLSIIYDRPTFALYMGNYEDQALFDKSRKLVRAIKPKTGTSTVLLGGDLYEKVIIRGGRLFFNGKPYGVGLPKSSVEAWKEAYEFNWKSVGLDYNPIEPILKDKKGNYLIKKNKDGTFRVYAGVLPAFTHFAFTRKEGTKKYVGDVKRNGKIVLDTLDSMMWHGHMHPFNLLVGVKEGKARVYAIDFDRAKLKKFLPAKN